MNADSQATSLYNGITWPEMACHHHFASNKMGVFDADNRRIQIISGYRTKVTTNYALTN